MSIFSIEPSESRKKLVFINMLIILTKQLYSGKYIRKNYLFKYNNNKEIKYNNLEIY